jgi:hypothetical protein
MSGTTFTVGQGRQCNLWLKDPSVSTNLCRLRHIEVNSLHSAMTLLIVPPQDGL